MTLKFSSTHQWAQVDEKGIATVGITDHAQEVLGDIVFVELPSVGQMLAAQEACAIVESVKSASDVHAPLSGEVIAVNTALHDAPEKINETAYESWLFKVQMQDPAEFEELLTESEYQALL